MIDRIPGQPIHPRVFLRNLLEMVEASPDTFGPETSCIATLAPPGAEPFISMCNMPRDRLAFLTIYFDTFARRLMVGPMSGTLEMVSKPNAPDPGGAGEGAQEADIVPIVRPPTPPDPSGP